MQDAISPREFAHPYAHFPSVILEAETAKEEEKTPKPEDISGIGGGASVDTMSKPPEEQILFVESKYCTICNIEQPLRCKHCRDCESCVTTYDHHCPWLGNCVGEKNRSYYFWYLVF